MSQSNDPINTKKRSLSERPISETLLRGRGTSSNRRENSPAIHRPTTQNSITPATVRRQPGLPLTNAAVIHRPTTQNSITPATARRQPGLPLTNAAGVLRSSTTPQEECQRISQTMLDFVVSTKITESSALAKSQCDELNKFIVAEKERLEADAKSRLKIDIELCCREPLRSIDSLLIDQFDALEIQNQRMNTRLSTLSKERNDACYNLNRQMAEFRVLETQFNEQRNLSEH
jgi:hypothetical protein